MASKRSQTRRTEERVRSARERAADEADDIRELEDQLATEVEAIWKRWRVAATKIEPVKVGLEKNDIQVSELRVFWASRNHATNGAI